LALHQAIDREPELMVEAVRTQELATNLRQQIKPIRESLSLFELLDQQLSEASERRALHLPDYLLFIANEQLASTLEIRQQEFTQLEIEHQLLQQANQRAWRCFRQRSRTATTLNFINGVNTIMRASARR
jgi:hypothetical protein